MGERIFIGILCICMVLFPAGTIWYMHWYTNQSQHAFCKLIDTLNAAPAPTSQGVTPKSNPARAYDLMLAEDFRSLKIALGC